MKLGNQVKTSSEIKILCIDNIKLDEILDETTNIWERAQQRRH